MERLSVDELLDKIRRYIGRHGVDHDELTQLVDRLDDELTNGGSLPAEWGGDPR